MQRNHIQKLFFSKKASLAVAVVIVIAAVILRWKKQTLNH